MSAMNPSLLIGETKIVWLEDINHLDYVRESIDIKIRRPSRKPSGPPGRVVGYAEVDKKIGGFYYCRVFWLKDYDRDSGNDTYRECAPCEAVDPRTVSPGVSGVLTDRAWNGGCP